MTEATTDESSKDGTTLTSSTFSETVPPQNRGRPRSTSISSGSPNPAPGVPLPSLLQHVALAPPQLSNSTNSNPFPFSFPSGTSSSSASTSLASNLGPQQWGKTTSVPVGGGGGGHKSSLSIPGIVSPSPLVPGAVPRGGRHRRTQSVSPPGFSMSGENGLSTTSDQAEVRRSSEPSVPVSKPENALGVTVATSPRQPRLNISTSIGTRLGQQRSPSSPTRSPRAKPLFSTSPTNPSPFDSQSHSHSQSHPSHHPHLPSPQHHPPLSSHAALLQGVRSHALPHSPTLEASSAHHHDISPLSTSPSMLPQSGFTARRLSGGQHSSSRPFISTSLSASSFSSPSSSSLELASPPFGPTSSSPNGRLSPIPFELSRSDAICSDNLRHVALDQAMTDAISDQYSTSPPSHPVGSPRTRRSSGSSYSPPLLPLPFDVHTPASPSGPKRPRSGSITRSTTSSTSPASLFLEEDQGESSPNGLAQDGSSPLEVCTEEIDISRPPSPPLPTESLFPTSGPLPAPSAPVSLSSLGFDIPSSIVASPPREHAPKSSSPTLNATPLSPTISNLSASRPSSSHSPILTLAPLSPALADSNETLPPASPHQKPISLPPPLNAPTPLPPHLVGGSAARSRSRSRSREREKERTRESSSSRSRSRSGSREREEGGGSKGDAGERPRSPIASGLGATGMRLTGLEFVPKVHSPLASPPATESEQNSKMSDIDDMEESRNEPVEDRDLTEEGASEGLNIDTSGEVTEPPTLPPPIPPPSKSPTVSSALGLPHLSIPTATSPVGTPEHLEESPTSHSSYFALAPGAALARSPSPLPDHLATLPDGPPLERAPSWEDELDEDEFDDLDNDGTGELGFTSSGRRKSSGTKAEEARVSLLQALGITKTQAEREEERELSERAAERRRIELDMQERERLELIRKERDEWERQRDQSSLGFMDVDLEAQEDGERESKHENENEMSHGFGEAGDLSVGDLEDPLTIDEESLSALERIFVCAKSEAVEERARVAHSLADWLPAVEICEAVEYVLPLLASLIEDEMVKEVFAPQLDRIMWHFFSHCPLTELEPGFEKESSASSSDNPVPSRYKPRSDSLVENSPVPSLSGPSDRSATPPPTSETSPAQSETSNPNLPRISATTFTALLGALLTDQSTTVAKAAETSIVRFLCRLKNLPLPPVSEGPDLGSLDFGQIQPPAPAISEPDPHSIYDFSCEARQILEDEVVSGIVIGLARLDEEDPERSIALDDPEAGKTRVEEIKEEEANKSPVLFTSPEEKSFELDEEDADLEARILMEWEQEWQRKASQDSTVDVPASSSPQEQIFSSFSPEGPADEESSIGKMVSMSLIGAIALANCLESTVLIKQFLPEVERMKAESMFYVRKEAVQALGNLASALPAEELEHNVLPLHTFFSKDQLWLVRRAAVLALPAVCKRLPGTALHEKVVEAIRHFSVDENRNVRSGALEIAGELIYLFHEDPAGVPEELLAFFLGKSLDLNGDHSTNEDEANSFANHQFSHFKSALESPSSSFVDASTSWQSPGFFAQKPRDADRSILTAFNFPAVILTLGRDKWNLVCDQHQALCKDPVEKARQSLASSLHEVAKIIGPDQSDGFLLEPLSAFLQDVENVQSAALENLPTLLVSFGSETAKKALRILGDAWPDIGNWRLREHALKKVADFGPHFMQNDGEEEVLTVLAKAFKDSVASVREQAVTVIPLLLNSVLDRPPSRAKLFAFLGVFRTDSSYRNRVAYVSTVVACVRASLPRDCFELYFLDTLVDLARDKVVSVRIAVARAISEACQCSALYSEPSHRVALREVLSILVDSPDRDVRLPVLDYCSSSPSPSSEASPLSPLKTRKILSYGVNVEDSPEVVAERHDDDAEDSFMEEQEDDRGREETENRDDVTMHSESDGVLLERPSTGSEDVLTRDEGDFVEVTRS